VVGRIRPESLSSGWLEYAFFWFGPRVLLGVSA
jgi:hypothetical protein